MNMLKLLEKNRSYRRFTDRTITDEQMNTLITAASLTASAANLQQLRFLPVCDKAGCAAVFPHLRWAGYLAEWDGPQESERPTGYMIVLCPKQSESKVLLGMDVGIAAQSILLTATEMGLGGCMFAGIDRPALLEALGIDGEQWAVPLVVALGEPCEQVRIVAVTDGNIKYYRDGEGVHYVPKRSPEELVFKK